MRELGRKVLLKNGEEPRTEKDTLGSGEVSPLEGMDTQGVEPVGNSLAVGGIGAVLAQGVKGGIGAIERKDDPPLSQHRTLTDSLREGAVGKDTLKVELTPGQL